MGKVFYNDLINYISGKISRKYRTCYNHKRASGLNFTSVHGDRTTQPCTDELKHREKFKTVSEAARRRAIDPMRLNYDRMDFFNELKAKGATFKYTTYRGWLFGKAWKCYDATTGQVNMPERLNTIA